MPKVELDLTDADIIKLTSALQKYISDLSMEIADTDSFDFREDLKSERISLQKVVNQIKSK